MVTQVTTPTPVADFSLWLQNQKESDLSHLGDLSNIPCGHFDGKIGGTTLPGGKPSKTSW